MSFRTAIFRAPACARTAANGVAADRAPMAASAALNLRRFMLLSLHEPLKPRSHRRPHARLEVGAAARRYSLRIAAGDGALLPLPAAAPDRARDGADVPQAEDGLRGVHGGWSS